MSLNKSGTGLGLNLSKQLSNKLGGDITVKSTYKKGTTFTLYVIYSPINKSHLELEDNDLHLDRSKSNMIPLEVANSKPNDMLDIIKKEKTYMSFNSTVRCKILLVDDVPSNIMVASKLFQILGYQSIKAFNGQEAIELVKKEHLQIKVAFIDLNMPGINGYELCTALLALMQKKEISNDFSNSGRSK